MIPHVRFKAMTIPEWTRIRQKLKTEFLRKGITVCEMCGGSFGLGFAHRYKRRFLTTDEEKRTVILCCQICHRQLDEGMSHEQMYETVTKVIENRNSLAEMTAA